jgi:hypothetical protein
MLYVRVISTLFLIPILFINPFGVAIKYAIPSLGVFGTVIGFLITTLFFILVNYSIFGYLTLQKGLRTGDSDTSLKGVRMLESWYQKLTLYVWLSMPLAIFFIVIMAIVQIAYAIYAFVFLIMIYAFSLVYRKTVSQLIRDIRIGLSDQSPHERFLPHAKWLAPYMYGMIVVIILADFLIAIATSILGLNGEMFVILHMFILSFACIIVAKHLKKADVKLIRFRRQRLDQSKGSISDIANT